MSHIFFFTVNLFASKILCRRSLGTIIVTGSVLLQKFFYIHTNVKLLGMGIYNILKTKILKKSSRYTCKTEGNFRVVKMFTMIHAIIENMNLLNKVLMPINIIMKDLVCLQVHMYIDKYFQPWWCFGSLSGRCMESYIDLMKGDKLYTNDFWVDCFVYIYLKKKILLWPGSRYLHGKKDNAMNVRRKGAAQAFRFSVLS